MAYVFDGTTKIISLTPGTVYMSVTDLWSRWLDWLSISDNSKYPLAMKQVGTEPIDPSSGTAIPTYVFLLNGWRVRPQESNHVLGVGGGILLVDGGGDPFVATLGTFMIRINYQQPVQAITVATGGGGGSTPADIWNYSNRTLSDGSINDVISGIEEIKGSGFDTVSDSLKEIKKTTKQAANNALL